LVAGFEILFEKGGYLRGAVCGDDDVFALDLA
jgi:hypothetical protein